MTRMTRITKAKLNVLNLPDLRHLWLTGAAVGNSSLTSTG
jgi:hypothetical protein